MIEGKGEKKMDYDPVVRERSEVKGLRGKNKTNKKKRHACKFNRLRHIDKEKGSIKFLFSIEPKMDLTRG